MRRVIIESPYAGQVLRNLRYLRACMRECLLRGDAPFASHALYTQEGVLRDDIQDERELGMQAGFSWIAFADATCAYVDLGVSKGMRAGIDQAEKSGIPVEYRNLKGFRSEDY